MPINAPHMLQIVLETLVVTGSSDSDNDDGRQVGDDPTSPFTDRFIGHSLRMP